MILAHIFFSTINIIFCIYKKNNNNNKDGGKVEKFILVCEGEEKSLHKNWWIRKKEIHKFTKFYKRLFFLKNYPQKKQVIHTKTQFLLEVLHNVFHDCGETVVCAEFIFNSFTGVHNACVVLLFEGASNLDKRLVCLVPGKIHGNVPWQGNF